MWRVTKISAVIVLATACVVFSQVEDVPVYIGERSGFHNISNHRYYINEELIMPWLQAAQFCASIDMTLLSLELQPENDALQDYLGINNMTGSFWTSGHRIQDTWIWTSTGQSFKFTAWGSNQPNATNVVDACVYTRGSVWLDGTCEIKAFHICE